MATKYGTTEVYNRSARAFKWMFDGDKFEIAGHTSEKFPDAVAMHGVRRSVYLNDPATGERDTKLCKRDKEGEFRPNLTPGEEGRQNLLSDDPTVISTSTNRPRNAQVVEVSAAQAALASALAAQAPSVDASPEA